MGCNKIVRYTRVEKECLQCHTKFLCYKNQKFCSKFCFYVWKTGKTYEEIYGKEKAESTKNAISLHRGNRRNGPLSYYPEKHCEVCGIKLERNSRFCSKKCYFIRYRNIHSINPKKIKSIHWKEILEQAKGLEEQGYRVIPITSVIPDIIAIKDNKIFAVEVEGLRSTKNKPDKKYDENNYKHFFDDIKYIFLKKKLKKEIYKKEE